MADTFSGDNGFRGGFGNSSPGGSGCEDDGLYEDLWQSCAGLPVNIPSVGDDVIYFTQGHIEQFEASKKRRVNQQMLPQIRCRVIEIQLRANKKDEPYYWAKLIPLPESSDAGVDRAPKSAPPAPKPKKKVHCFCKTLTASDTGTHGSFYLRRQHAVECFPPLDMSQQSPTQELVAQDIHGGKWRFNHTFSAKSKRHKLTAGWSVFVHAKKLVAGDAIVFLRGENGELRVGVRRMMKQQTPAFMSTYKMDLKRQGVITKARDAVSYGKMFLVVYTARTSQSEFIISYDKYMEAVNSNIAVRMRFNMIFEEEHRKRMSTGTIIDIDMENPWRSLKVKWAKQSVINRPERVSPWEIEPIVAPPSLNPLPRAGDKRPRQDSTGFSMLASSKCVVDPLGQRYPGSTPGDKECESSQREDILWGAKAKDGQADGGLTHVLPGGPDPWMLRRQDSQFSGITGDILTPRQYHNNCGMHYLPTIEYTSPQPVTQVAEPYENTFNYIQERDDWFPADLFFDGNGDLEIPHQD